MTSFFVCPVCGASFVHDDRIYRCENGHCFDRSRFGYVNFLQSQRSSKKRHGDDKAMVTARRDFLNAGFYRPLCERVASLAAQDVSGPVRLLDAGCGEGYYTDFVRQTLAKTAPPKTAGVDISKDALRFAAKRSGDIEYAVASVFKLPVQTGSVDLLLNLFAPVCESEFLRVLKKGGRMVRAFPDQDHLLGLKQAVYETVRVDEIASVAQNGFAVLEHCRLSYELRLQNQTDIMNLFHMTPYYYKTSRENQQKLNGVQTLCTPVAFHIVLFQKI